MILPDANNWSSALLRERQELEVRVKERTDELSSAYVNLVKEGEVRERAYEELKKSEEELRKRKEFIETVLNNLPIGLAVQTLPLLQAELEG